MMEQRRSRNALLTASILVLCALTAALDFLDIEYVVDEFKNRMIAQIFQQSCGAIAAILLMIRLNIRLFVKPQQLLYLIPCVIIAVDNFPFCSYFNGNMQFVEADVMDHILFIVYCLCVGIFEECIFRGIIFSVLASRFSMDKKGFLLTYLFSSFIFGGAHLFNLLSGAGIGATILQVGYTILTGGLFAFALIKTRNILCAAGIHALYNFCGLLLSEQGLGTGIVFDIGTIIMMALISICVGAFVLYKIWKTSNEEIQGLYNLLGIKNNAV